MKNLATMKVFILLSVLFLGIHGNAQNPVNWTDKQLIDPSDLATAIKNQKDVPVIISVGPGATIPNTLNVGMVNSAEGLQILKDRLKDISRDTKIVIYCGCCPFEHCPNVRPAIDVLNEQKFTNYFLLNIPHNIKIDWIEKGYPVSKS